MLVRAKFLGLLMRRPARRNKENAVQMKALLRGGRYCDVSGVYRIERAAKKGDVPAFSRFLAARRGRLRLQMRPTAFTISPFPKPFPCLCRTDAADEN